MSFEDLKTLEIELGIHPPEAYFTFLRELKEWVTPEFTSANPEVFYTSTLQLLDLNQGLRADGASYVLEGLPWPDSFFAFGEDGNGAVYAIDVALNLEIVWEYNHEAGLFGQAASNLRHFAEQQQQAWLTSQHQERKRIQVAEQRLERKRQQRKKPPIT